MYQVRGRHNLVDCKTSVTSLDLINVTESRRISLPDGVHRVWKATGCLTSRAHCDTKRNTVDRLD